MKTSKVLIYGILFWIALFISSLLLFTFIKSESYFGYQQSFQPLFLSVQIILCGVFSYTFYKNYKVNSLKDSFVIGLLWVGISILMDFLFELLLFQTVTLFGEKYNKNVVPYYFIYPLTTLLVSFLINRNNHNLKKD